MKYILLYLLLLCYVSQILALPITTSTITTTTTTTTSETVFIETDNEESYNIQIDRLSNLITQHIQFDHLDAIITNTDNLIAKEFQHHLQINIESDNTNILPTVDVMDLEILKAQIFAAIQAHTEGSLPLVWDRLSNNLSKQSIELYVRNLLISTCQDTDTISLDCLQENSLELTANLDNYIKQNLVEIYNTLDNEVLPTLLEHTAKDLKGILNYFNIAFLNDENMKFILEVLPWNNDLDERLQHQIQTKLFHYDIDHHSSSFFIEFASMARV